MRLKDQCRTLQKDSVSSSTTSARLSEEGIQRSIWTPALSTLRKCISLICPTAPVFPPSTPIKPTEVIYVLRMKLKMIYARPFLRRMTMTIVEWMISIQMPCRVVLSLIRMSLLYFQTAATQCMIHALFFTRTALTTP